MKISVEHLYTSVACNRTPEIVDWNNEGLICFGATNAVVIYNTLKKGKDPLQVLSHHRSKVNSVKWIKKPNGTCTEMVSCSADKTAAVWTLQDGLWHVTSKLTGHTDGVTSVYGLYTCDDDMTVYTASIDSTIQIWERTNGIFKAKQTICLNSGLCLTLHAHLLPVVNKPMLFCALDDHKIHIFAGDEEYHRIHMLAGHEDWVRGLDVLNVDSSTILLASASQDTFIRIWRIQHCMSHNQPVDGVKVEQKLLHAYEQEWSVKLDAVLAGHEGWVYGVQWHPFIIDQGTSERQPVYRLLSSSLDKTLIIWEPDSSQGEGGVWVESVRVGEVGGNGLGFYGSRFGPGGLSFLGHGYNGSFHVWALDKETNQWSPQVVCGGHFGSVEDLSWEPAKGRYLISVSADQTTRLHAPWKMPDGGAEWHELARPQVHGYDMCAVCAVRTERGALLASAADEKVVRVFRAPHNFAVNFANVVGDALADGGVDGPEGAAVPSLGLSNKAVFSGDEDPNDDGGHFVPVDLTEPPTEETLQQSSLWPETHKLYAHGSEVFALAASPDGRLLASAARATHPDHAAPVLWETSTWSQLQKLVCHQLTVTALAFSGDSSRLLSVSRDRRWALHQRGDGGLFELVAHSDGTNGIHTRIIWCCAWDGDRFLTGSRDGKVCTWGCAGAASDTSLRGYAASGAPLDARSAVTALAVALRAPLVALGLESGVVRLYRHTDTWDHITDLDNSSAHHLTVKRLVFRPVDSPGELTLASCGADHLVRIYRLHVTDHS